ncbi:Multisubunit Na+/H+ antiporter, MnhE subunit [Hahella chejuensis KCTC 2396]|uniref:Multisubunit Na+/H+ antiporter, MnhE subunit n=1 Tax=Hahella chejuensis (strain KCTC 2396) TaxID=349521 RepID=Q2SNS8_HAHCH|nr:Na+/H+ antiporter subunit E [Hahella chejuensis]ABC27696.1 Multisubunit Na+/H+ antiporter, MnhE subunit [Hahella chejuensis KCTC 2396]
MVNRLRMFWFPSPWLSLLLFVAWLMLNNSVAPGHLALGGVLAIAIPRLTAPLSDPQPRLKRPGLAIRYVLLVLGDIIRDNFRVAKMIMGPNQRLQPAFVALPLELHEPLPLTILAGTISLTPGTVSVEVSEDRLWLYLHTLHLDDEAALIAHIKGRYEAVLKEIFEC